MHLVRVADQRLQVAQLRRTEQWFVQAQQGELAALVAVGVVLHDHGPFAGQVAAGDGARKRRKRGPPAIGELDQLGRTGLVGPGQHLAGVGDVEGPPAGQLQ